MYKSYHMPVTHGHIILRSQNWLSWVHVRNIHGELFMESKFSNACNGQNLRHELNKKDIFLIKRSLWYSSEKVISSLQHQNIQIYLFGKNNQLLLLCRKFFNFFLWNYFWAVKSKVKILLNCILTWEEISLNSVGLTQEEDWAVYYFSAMNLLQLNVM